MSEKGYSEQSVKVTVKPDKVALWARGLMMSVISRIEAEKLVAEGRYQWIHSGAIDWKESA